MTESIHIDSHIIEAKQSSPATTFLININWPFLLDMHQSPWLCQWEHFPKASSQVLLFLLLLLPMPEQNKPRQSAYIPMCTTPKDTIENKLSHMKNILPLFVWFQPLTSPWWKLAVLLILLLHQMSLPSNLPVPTRKETTRKLSCRVT